MNGFVNLLKPAGMTSSDAVLCVKKLLPRKTAVGHGGTLDPDAAGVLPICVGKATRLFNYIIDKEKTYIGELCLGITTTTDDASGEILEVKAVNATEDDVKAVLPRFTGDTLQVPPMFSALKRDGVALYKLARKGETIELESRPVHIESIELIGKNGANKYLLKIICGKGTYIRSLMRDIGEALGCGGHMSFLMRSAAGVFDCEHAHTIEELRAAEDLEALLEPMDAPLIRFPEIHVREEFRGKVINGVPLTREMLGEDMPDGGYIKLYCGNDFAGMGEVTEEGCIKIKCMLLETGT